ncbi:MAG: hypothetical protein N3F63_03645 [Thermoplasmata archaeon]|nr:hypothetical protein [Thermoplasmata archaeon]
MLIERLEAFTKLRALSKEVDDLWKDGKKEEAEKKEEELKKIQGEMEKKGYIFPLIDLDTNLKDLGINRKILANMVRDDWPYETINVLLDFEAFAYEGVECMGEEEINDLLTTNRRIIRIGMDRKCWNIVDKGYRQSIDICMIFGYFERAYKLSEEFLHFGEKRDDPRIIGDALKTMVTCAIERGHFGKAIELLNRKIEIEKNLGREVTLSGAYGTLANLYVEAGNITKAEKVVNEGVELCRHFLHIDPLLTLSLADAKIDMKKGRYEESIGKARKIIENWERLESIEWEPDPDVLLEIYFLIADNYAKMEQGEKEIEVLKEGYEKMKEKFPDLAADLCDRIAYIYFQRNSLVECEAWAKKSEELRESFEEEEDGYEDTARGDDKGGSQ